MHGAGRVLAHLGRRFLNQGEQERKRQLLGRTDIRPNLEEVIAKIIDENSRYVEGGALGIVEEVNAAAPVPSEFDQGRLIGCRLGEHADGDW